MRCPRPQNVQYVPLGTTVKTLRQYSSVQLGNIHWEEQQTVLCVWQVTPAPTKMAQAPTSVHQVSLSKRNTTKLII